MFCRNHRAMEMPFGRLESILSIGRCFLSGAEKTEQIFFEHIHSCRHSTFTEVLPWSFTNVIQVNKSIVEEVSCHYFVWSLEQSALSVYSGLS